MFLPLFPEADLKRGIKVGTLHQWIQHLWVLLSFSLCLGLGDISENFQVSQQWSEVTGKNNGSGQGFSCVWSSSGPKNHVFHYPWFFESMGVWAWDHYGQWDPTCNLLLGTTHFLDYFWGRIFSLNGKDRWDSYEYLKSHHYSSFRYYYRKSEFHFNYPNAIYCML